MKSKCLKYDIPSSACFPESSGTVGKEQWGPIAYQYGDGYEMSVASDNTITSYTVTNNPFNKTKTDSFGKEHNAETYRIRGEQALSKDFYGMFIT
jgi:hypothetical protein